MWKESNRNIVVIFQPNILRIVGFYVRHSAYMDRALGSEYLFCFKNLDMILRIMEMDRPISFKTQPVLFESTEC